VGIAQVRAARRLAPFIIATARLVVWTVTRIIAPPGVKHERLQWRSAALLVGPVL